MTIWISLFCHHENVDIPVSLDIALEILVSECNKFIIILPKHNYVTPVAMYTALACGAPCSMPVKLGH